MTHDHLNAMASVLHSYAAALRTHRLSDAEVTEKLVAVGLRADEAEAVIAALDAGGWAADSNSTPTAAGWTSLLVGVGATGASGVLLARHLAIPLGTVGVVFVLPFVALGFGGHVACSKFLESFGIKTSISVPVPLPDETELRRMVEAARRQAPSRDTQTEPCRAGDG